MGPDRRRTRFSRRGVCIALFFASGCTSTIGGPGGDDPAAGNGGDSGSSGASRGGSSASSGASGTSGTGGTSGSAGTGAGSGTGGEPPLPPDDVERACAAMNGMLNAGITKLRRMTRTQFDNTTRDLVGSSGTPSDAIAPDERIGPFNSNAIAPITELIVQQHMEVAGTLALDATSRMASLTGCELSSGASCVTRFVTEFGLRAYRRPLEADEVSRYVSLYDLGAQGGGVQNGFRLVVEAMLQAPSFLYHADVGASGTPAATPVPLTSYELASRLSYFIWNSMPDPALFALAAGGTLADTGVLGGEVERLLGDSKAAATIGLFHRQWLQVDELPSKEKDPALFPLYGPTLVTAMLAETNHFSDYVVRRGDGLLRTLFTSNLGFPDGALFDVYGATRPQGYSVGTPVPLDGSERAGILTQAAFLARHSHRDQTSPVHRGLVVRENLLCQMIAPPPPDVNAVPPPPSQATTTRERFAQHSEVAACAGCHVSMDPIGLGFEHYDSIGAYRTTDGLGAVDATGEIVDVDADLVGPFVGALELANKLAGSRQVENCVAAQWFRFSLGRIESQNDACSIQAIREGFRASGGNIRSLIAEIALSDAFRHVRSTEN